MDLLGKVAVIVIVLIAVFSAVFVLLRHSSQQAPLTSAQAIQVVLKDIKDSNPGANVTVINVSNSTLERNSYNIVLSIVYNSTRACPTLFIEQFDYPATELVQSIPNLYTKNCIVYGLSNVSTYVISSPYIAIARSYNQSVTHNVTQVTYYVSDYGYNNTAVTAQHYSYLNNTQTHLAQSYYNVWLVRYKAKAANYSVYTVLDSLGDISANYTASP
jgi:hypothetical protein